MTTPTGDTYPRCNSLTLPTGKPGRIRKNFGSKTCELNQFCISGKTPENHFDVIVSPQKTVSIPAIFRRFFNFPYFSSASLVATITIKETIEK
jgi:hypothetical protein